MPENFIVPHGNYRQLRAFQAAEVVYDMTFRFCERFLKKGDRTIDQLVQAARSGKQNIAEGSRASGTSKETEIKLTERCKSIGRSWNIPKGQLLRNLQRYLGNARARNYCERRDLPH